MTLDAERRDEPSPDALRFAFGRNWARFSASITEERIRAAERGLRRMAPSDRLDGLTFLDIGCGSGLSSLAALRLGARVVAFDHDPDSVETAKRVLAARAPTGSDYSVQRGSTLDPDYLAGLGQFDVVYSWGVLHHTGAMWTAMELAASRVKPDGHFAVALYNDQGGASRRWLAIKRAYMKSPALARFALVLAVGAWFETRAALIRLVRFQNPLPFADWRRRKTERGMSVWNDLVDWVGGYPFEVARPEEVLDFGRERGFVLERMATRAGGHACNEFLFRKQQS